MERSTERTRAASHAFRFVLTMGIVNFFADVTYEGGASINGPFLGPLGASAAAISIIAGLGEFLGYSLRSVYGYVSYKYERPSCRPVQLQRLAWRRPSSATVYAALSHRLPFFPCHGMTRIQAPWEGARSWSTRNKR